MIGFFVGAISKSLESWSYPLFAACGFADQTTRTANAGEVGALVCEAASGEAPGAALRSNITGTV
jgi:hypothetical protein